MPTYSLLLAAAGIGVFSIGDTLQRNRARECGPNKRYAAPTSSIAAGTDAGEIQCSQDIASCGDLTGNSQAPKLTVIPSPLECSAAIAHCELGIAPAYGREERFRDPRPSAGEKGMVMQVKSLMTTHVIDIRPTATLAHAARLMLTHGISGLPVVDETGRLVGIISEGDFLRRSELSTKHKRSRWLEFFISPGKAAAEYVQEHGRTIAEVMSTDVATISDNASLEEAVELMAHRGVKRLPVIENGKLIGIVTRADLMRAFLVTVPTPGSTASYDDLIRKNIIAELANQTWSGNGSIRVKVDKGVAELCGVIFDERERQAARVVAENVSGVKSVIDQLAWMDPTSGMYMAPPV